MATYFFRQWISGEAEVGAWPCRPCWPKASKVRCHYHRVEQVLLGLAGPVLDGLK